MADDHIFVASGDSCPICMALDGTIVPEGYTAHDNCMCSTIPKDADQDCEHGVENIDFQTSPSGSVIASFEVTVTCPDGSEAGASGSVEVDPVTHNPIKELWDAVGDLASEICESCPEEEEEEEPFNCC